MRRYVAAMNMVDEEQAAKSLASHRLRLGQTLAGAMRGVGIQSCRATKARSKAPASTKRTIIRILFQGYRVTVADCHVSECDL
jgi:hypothetical protein